MEDTNMRLYEMQKLLNFAIDVGAIKAYIEHIDDLAWGSFPVELIDDGFMRVLLEWGMLKLMIRESPCIAVRLLVTELETHDGRINYGDEIVKNFDKVEEILNMMKVQRELLDPLYFAYNNRASCPCCKYCPDRQKKLQTKD